MSGRPGFRVPWWLTWANKAELTEAAHEIGEEQARRILALIGSRGRQGRAEARALVRGGRRGLPWLADPIGEVARGLIILHTGDEDLGAHRVAYVSLTGAGTEIALTRALEVIEAALAGRPVSRPRRCGSIACAFGARRRTS